MHYHCEVVIPPTDDIDAALKSVLAPFDENISDDCEDKRPSFWDWWIVGGRWSGSKLMSKYDAAKIDQFVTWMREEKITVSGLQFGKQELSPADQIGKVDAKWAEMFGTEAKNCPMFKHAGDNLPNDVCRLDEVPSSLTCERVIFAKRGYQNGKYTGPIEAEFMLCRDQWNGCNHMKVDWNGKFHNALKKYLKSISRYEDAFKEQCTPRNDWIVVTVDYHS